VSLPSASNSSGVALSNRPNASRGEHLTGTAGLLRPIARPGENRLDVGLLASERKRRFQRLGGYSNVTFCDRSPAKTGSVARSSQVKL